jgi:tripartite-type tricarboxylate transporter receptor subunit TctC
MVTMQWKPGLILLVVACALAGVASAQTFPTRQITLLVGFPPGGGTDGPSRVIADKMRASLGVPVVVENRPGGQQMVAIRALQASPPDGYTLLVGTGSSLAQNPALNPAIGYDPLRDFTLIGRFGVSRA